MRKPTDISLVTYIKELIENNNIAKFYKSDDWLELRAEVLEENNYECQGCIKLGRYKRAECVHHVNHVKDRPDLALSKTYKDKDNKEHKQLVPLCNQCHNAEHPEKAFKKANKERFMNEERW